MSHAERVAELGKGRFATVECWRMVDKKLVAIKSFSADNNQARERETELLNLVGPGCTYIAKVADLFAKVHNNMPCLVMEAYLGGPLTKHIQQCGSSKLDISVVQGYLCELVSAVAHLESVNCVHRDIKSRNCVLDHTGHLKLCDLGSATILAPVPMSRPTTASKADHDATARTSSRNSKTYTITGTSVIMAPEMAASTAGYDYSVDYWAVGVLLYELLTCRLPPWERTTTPLSSSADDKTLPVWPSEADAEVARVAIAMDRAVLTEGNTTQAEAKAPSRPGTATNKSDKSGTSDKSAYDIIHAEPMLVQHDHEFAHSAQRCWFLQTVDHRFGEETRSVKSNTSSSNSTNNDLNAILGNFSFTPKKSTEQVLRERAYDLVQILLTVCPARRFTRLSECQNHSAKLKITTKTNTWSSALRCHPFFDGVNWARVDAGLTPPPNEHFDRRLGCMELLSEFDCVDDELTDAQQALFEGF